jgi:hypothetical protein
MIMMILAWRHDSDSEPTATIMCLNLKALALRLAIAAGRHRDGRIPIVKLLLARRAAPGRAAGARWFKSVTVTVTRTPSLTYCGPGRGCDTRAVTVTRR